MTLDKLKELLAKPAVKARNIEIARELLYGKDTLPEDPVQDPQSERNQTPALVGSVSGKDQGVPRITIRFIGSRVRPLDPDNFAGGCKDLLDGLRHAGLIPGDAPDQVRCIFDQIKVSSKKHEGTEIFLTLD